MTSKKNRFFSILLTMLLLFSFCSTAFALNIVDEDLYDYFEYYEDGTWQISTPSCTRILRMAM